MKAVGLQQGRKTAKGEMRVLFGQVRRSLSVASARALSLLSKRQEVGRGTAAANKRRQAGEWREKSWAREKEAMMLDQAQDRMVVRRGQFFLDWRSILNEYLVN